MPKKIIFIIGSSRSSGNTRKVLDFVNAEIDAPIINLSDRNFTPYDYEEKNLDDDFLTIIEEIIQYETIVFATPVYWYAMSSQLKTFFDRFSDLVRTRKDLGRALAGKSTYLIATGTEETLPEGFEIPFKRSSEYMNMEYKGACFAYFKEDLLVSDKVQKDVIIFRNSLLS